MTDFSGHTVLVTGAGGGIGFAIAAAFHTAGGRVALGDLREPEPRGGGRPARAPRTACSRTPWTSATARPCSGCSRPRSGRSGRSPSSWPTRASIRTRPCSR